MANQKSFSFRVTGAKELERAFTELGATLSKRVLLAALRDVAKPVKRDAERLIISRTKVKTGRLARSMKVSTRRGRSKRGFSPRTGTAQIFVGSTAPHAHLIEFGTSPRFRKGGGFTGQVAARSFMRPAWEINKAGIMKGLIKAVWKAIVKTARTERKRAQAGKKTRF